VSDIGVRLLHLDWEDIQRLAEAVARKVNISGFIPDVVVAISRGGFDPARILCDQLSVQRLASLQVEYYTGVDQRRGAPEIVFPLNADVPNLKVLIVDDVSDSGNSLKTAMDHVCERGASEVRVATLHVKPWSNFRPDYYAEEVEAWVVYPWELVETLKCMAERFRSEGLDPTEVKRKLLENGFDPELVEKLF